MSVACAACGFSNEPDDKFCGAADHQATAITMYRDMGMTHWAEKAEALSR